MPKYFTPRSFLNFLSSSLFKSLICLLLFFRNLAMKRIKHFFLVLSLVLITNSCEENGIFFPPSENNGVFEVTIDGEVFTTSEVSFVNDDSTLGITAIKSETQEIFTLVVEDYAARSFSFEGINNVASYIQNDPVSADIWSTFGETSSRGNIAFTNIDFVNNTVSGTFSFIGKNLLTDSSKAFSNGTFTNIPRTNLPISQDDFTAKVDGVAFNDTTLFASSITLGSTELISINANTAISEAISLTLNADITPGEYDFGSIGTYPSALYNVNNGAFIGDGKLNITNHDTGAKRISGTFSFDASPLTGATPSYTITEGTFSVSY